MAARLGVLLVALATSSPLLAASPPNGQPSAAKPIVHKVGLCRVRALSAVPSTGAPRTRSFLVEVGARRVLVAPNAGSFRASSSGERRIDAVLLTSLSEAALDGVVQDGAVAYSGSRIFVDRELLEKAKTSDDRSDRRNLDRVLASGRLYTPEANVDVLPGVRFTIPHTRSPAPSRVKIRCGDQTLVVLDGSELASSGFDRMPAASLDGEDPAHLRSLAGDRAMLAITSGPFPALASIYRHADGFHLGPIEAKEYGGATPRRGEVIVEDTLSP